jgi:hypothetical protein
MKFAFYIEPYRVFHSHFYTYRIFGDEFLKRGHTFHYYTPIDYQIDSMKQHNKKKKLKMDSLDTLYGIKINIGFPEPEDYDILLLESQYYKNWCDMERDMRILLAAKFSLKNKTIIVLHDSMLMETRIIPLNNIIYGTTSVNLLKIDNKKKRILSHFTMPPINYLINSKPKSLTLTSFYSKYNLNPTLKIIAFLPGKLNKWQEPLHLNTNRNYFKNSLATNNFYINNMQIHWIIENIEKIIFCFKKMGYQIVGKMHIRDFSKFRQNDKSGKILMKDNITYVQQYDLHELLKYSDFALTFGSTMVYQLYLYNLPSIELGTGFYFPGWAYPTTDDFSYMKYITDYNYGKDLIYGHVIDFNKFKNNISTYLIKLMENKYNINKFKYQYNNPIYGNSYGKTIDTIYNSIIKLSTALYLTNLKNKIIENNNAHNKDEYNKDNK